MEVAADGVEALEKLRSGRRYSFLLVDLKMPRLGGLDLLAEISRDATITRVPVVVLTSSEAPEDVATAYARGAAAYFVKPMSSFTPLLERILAFMRSARAPEPGPGLIRDPPPPDGAPPGRAGTNDGILVALVRSSADAIIGFDLAGTIVSWNAAAARLYGYTETEALGRTCRIIVSEPRHAEFHRVLEEVAGGGAVQAFETERVDREGRSLVISLTVSPIRDHAGPVRGVSAIARDITDRHRADERFRLAVESAPSGMLMVDASGAIVIANAEAEKMFGYPRGQLLGRSIEDLVPDRLAAQHPAHREVFRARPEARAMGAGRELYAVRRDGSEFPVEIGLNPIDTPDGLFVLAAVVDITERKQADERFRLAVESSPNGMVMSDEDGTIVLVNAETERMFGYEREELVGRSIDTLVPARFRGQHPRHRETFQGQPAARAMGTGRDLYAVRSDGSEFPVEIGLNPIRTSEGMLVLSGIVDITERKHAEDELSRRSEELARSNAELQQFAYVASHDLQEPLRMVASFSQLLAEEYSGAIDEGGRAYLTYVVEGAVRMQNLIRDLLAFARASVDPKETAAVELAEIVQVAVANLRLTIEEAGAGIEVGELPAVRCNRGRLAQVVQNLIANALRFRSAEAPRVRITAARRGESVEVRVEDNGIGIPPQHREHVFEIFRRLRRDSTDGGTGIGLAICRRIVEQGGGRIWVEPGSPSGTAVCFSVPAG